MQYGIGSFEHSFSAHLASRRTEEGEQFGGAPSLILMWLSGWMAFRLPGSPRLGDGLVRPGFIFVELHDPGGFCVLARQLD